MLKPWYARAVNAGTQLVNMYGITETTVHVTYRALEAADAHLVGVSPIGVRIPDLQLYVLDARREPCLTVWWASYTWAVPGWRVVTSTARR